MYEAYKLSQKHNFKVLYGSEFYFSVDKSSRRHGHLILIAKNNEGLKNLYRLQAKAYVDGFYYKPTINMTMLKERHEGLICLSACIANHIAQYVLQDECVLAMSHMYELKDIFKDDFYLELQSSTMEDVIKVNKKYEDWILQGLAKPIITNDVHYTYKTDWSIHEVLLCIQQKMKMANPKRWKFEKHDYWLKSEEEIMEEVKYIKSSVLDQCLVNIQEIVDKCDVKFETGNFLPHYNGMEKKQEDEELERLSLDMYLQRVCKRKEGNDEFLRDIYKEISIIKETGYSGYFLIVQEYVNWAKTNHILVGDGRGSGAGSKVGYTIGISEVNPQKYDLLFERFLSIGREPDFDIDFSDIDAVFRHLQEVYGVTNVARVGAYNRMSCKSAIRKVLGAFDISQADISKLVGMLPNRLKFTFDECLAESAGLSCWFDEHADLRDIVFKLEGKISHMTTHAGGVIICNDLTSMLPITVVDGKMVVELDKHVLAELGHYKFDILGLESLVLLDNILQEIPDEIDWTKVDYEDQNIYDMLCKGDVFGVFQLSEQREKVVEQQPRNFEDLIAINALIRPGVGDWNEYLRRRRENVGTAFDRGLSYLKPTSGIIVYQEQYLLLAGTYAGWDIAYSDKHIRKNPDIRNDEELKCKFYHDSAVRGYEAYDIQEVWEEIVKVIEAGYGFNRSHSTSYAVLSFQTAYLKHYYPIQFYAALMTINGNDKEQMSNIKSLIDVLKIPLLPPDINLSDDTFKPTDKGILYRINSVNDVGGSALAEIERLKPIASLKDFIARRTPKFVKINSLVNLIKAGSFDFENPNRYEMLLELSTLTSAEVPIEKLPNYSYERDALGLYISEAPYDKYQIGKFSDVGNGQICTTVGEVQSVFKINDKNGNEMAFVNIINQHGVIKMVVFTKLWTAAGTETCLTVGNLIMVSGKKDKESLLVNKVEQLEVK